MLRNEQGLYLFLRRSPQSKRFAGQWEIPGGKADPGETIDQTLKREVSEETGLKIHNLHVAGAAEGNTPEACFVHLMMEAVVEPGEVRLSDEHDAFVWVTPADALKLDLSPVYIPLVRDFAARADPKLGK